MENTARMLYGLLGVALAGGVLTLLVLNTPPPASLALGAVALGAAILGLMLACAASCAGSLPMYALGLLPTAAVGAFGFDISPLGPAVWFVAACACFVASRKLFGLHVLWLVMIMVATPSWADDSAHPRSFMDIFVADMQVGWMEGLAEELPDMQARELVQSGTRLGGELWMASLARQIPLEWVDAPPRFPSADEEAAVSRDLFEIHLSEWLDDERTRLAGVVEQSRVEQGRKNIAAHVICGMLAGLMLGMGIGLSIKH